MKKVILIVVPLLLVGGGAGTFFAAKSGAIKIPGITPPAKKAAGGAALYGPDKKDDPVAKKETPSTSTPPPRRQPEPEKKQDDPVAGLKTLATLWGEMSVEPLSATTKDWTPKNLAPVLLMMEPEKVSKLLSEIAKDDPKRASEISRELQRAASEPGAPKFESA